MKIALLIGVMALLLGPVVNALEPNKVVGGLGLTARRGLRATKPTPVLHRLLLQEEAAAEGDAPAVATDAAAAEPDAPAAEGTASTDAAPAVEEAAAPAVDADAAAAATEETKVS